MTGEKPDPQDEPRMPDAPEAAEDAEAIAAGDGAPGETERLSAELERQRELHLRARADFDNFRKRSARERPLIAAQVKRDMVAALLPAIDALDMAVRHAGEDADLGDFLEGVRAARDAIESALAAQGVERIPAEGAYDPELHHVQAAVPGGDCPDGTILEELRAGYRVGKLVARHCEVVVAKNPDAGERGSGNGDREVEEAE
jgi:molecular chaperone GrpE